MIALNPADRPSFADVLDSARDVAFPETFYSFLYAYVISINETSSHALFARTVSAHARSQAVSATGTTNGANISGATGPESWGTLPSDSDHRIERIWAEFDSIEPILMAGEQIEQTVTALPPLPKVSLTSRPIQVSTYVNRSIPHQLILLFYTANIGHTPC
jgi:phosphoinositide-3-kinase regulatory subunit 4